MREKMSESKLSEPESLPAPMIDSCQEWSAKKGAGSSGWFHQQVVLPEPMTGMALMMGEDVKNMMVFRGKVV